MCRKRRRARSRPTWLCCTGSSRTGSSCASPPASDCSTARAKACCVPYRPDTSPRFRDLAGPADDRRGLSQRTAFRGAAGVHRASGSISAIAVPLFDRGSTVGVLAVRSRKAHASATTRSTSCSRCRTCSTSSLQRAETEEALNHAQRLETVGPADRWHRARLQQSAHDHPGQSAGARGTARAAGWQRGAAGRGRRAREQARRRADRQVARVLAPPGAAADARRREHDAAFAGRHAAPHAGPAHPHQRGCDTAVPAGAGRCRTARVGAAQRRDQRARRDAGGRPAVVPRRGESPAVRGDRRGRRTRAAGRLCRHLDRRQRRRHVRGGARARVRAVLHHQGEGPRHRPRPVHGVRLRQAIERHDRTRQQAGPRHHGDVAHPALARCGEPKQQPTRRRRGDAAARAARAAGRRRRRGAQGGAAPSSSRSAARSRRAAPPSRRWRRCDDGARSTCC